MADAPPAPVPVNEKGYTVTAGVGDWWHVPDPEQTPELRWPLSVRVSDQMRRQDAQVSSVLQAVTSPIERTVWRVDGTDCDPGVTAHIAGDLGLPIVGSEDNVRPLRTRDRFTWASHLPQALLYLVFGHSAFEQLYRLDDDLVPHIRKLGYRPPETISKFNVARDGGLTSIEQYADGAGTPGVTLPIANLVMYVHQLEGGNWAGTSLLRPAYKNWLLKDRLLRIQTQTIERNGMGIPVYEGADGETDLDAGRELASDIRSGDDAGAAISHGAKITLQGVQGELPDAMAPIRYHDEQIARAVLAHFLNLGSQTGSWALGSTFADFFTLSLQAIASEIRDVANAHIIEDLVDIAYGPDEPAPRLVFDEIGARTDSIVNSIAVLVNADVLHSDEDLEQFVRTALGLPAYSAVPLPKPPVEVPA